HRGPALNRRAYSRRRAGVSNSGSIEIETSRTPSPSSACAAASVAESAGQIDGQVVKMNCRTTGAEESSAEASGTRAPCASINVTGGGVISAMERTQRGEADKPGLGMMKSEPMIAAAALTPLAPLSQRERGEK